MLASIDIGGRHDILEYLPYHYTVVYWSASMVYCGILECPCIILSAGHWNPTCLGVHGACGKFAIWNWDLKLLLANYSYTPSFNHTWSSSLVQSDSSHKWCRLGRAWEWGYWSSILLNAKPPCFHLFCCRQYCWFSQWHFSGQREKKLHLMMMTMMTIRAVRLCEMFSTHKSCFTLVILLLRRHG